jgi:hypothetical protein
VFKTGKTNKLIADYMDVYEHFEKLWHALKNINAEFPHLTRI